MDDEKYMKNHPDITGMMSKDGGKMDKDEEEMMNDIGMNEDGSENSSASAKQEAKTTKKKNSKKN